MDKLNLKLAPAHKIDAHISDNELIIHRTQDCTDVLEKNQRIRNDLTPNKFAHGRLVASVPIEIYMEWQKEWKQNHSDKMEFDAYCAMKINDRDHEKFRFERL